MPALDGIIQELTLKKGQETHLGDWLVVDQHMIDGFAEVTKDPQWIHVDQDRAAKESPYGTTVAHGFLTLSLIPYLTDVVNPDRTAYPGEKLSVNYGLNRVRFPNAVPVDSKVRARSKLVSVDKISDECFQIIHEITVEVEGQDKPACVAETIDRYYF